MRILIEKGKRRLTLTDGGERVILSCPIALGKCPVGAKKQEGDGKTPEGEYFVCLKKQGKYGPSLGVSYPNADDALRAGLPPETVEVIRRRAERKERPPWGTALGGEIYVHGGGTASDWTAGCVALADQDAQALYDLTPLGTEISIVP